jgi:hypothetical protein
MGMPQGMPQQGMQQQMQQQMQQMGPGVFNQASNGMGAPPMQTPQNMAAFSGPPLHRREMKGPSGVDDILKTFQEVRNAEIDINPISIPSPEPSYYQQPARQAAVEISSIHTTPVSDVGSDATRTGSTGQRASRGKRKPQAPSGNTMTLNL